ncbi:beta-galactosidase [Alkalicoccus urumqiensis]|uniref:Beta-galactosidase n=1 Tax=Alkalicoccus urumqiensis TaxID=1548213 RepID=A0A2P6MEP0_ALKUR|nr:beta-galactosidase [Alkalicoccus urumqiensis]PRO64707.1 beta-galactosidase [Alkalicoccus urumqiensis]
MAHPLFHEKTPYFLHGADYNPEQWKRYPDVFEEDLRLMKKAQCNVMSVGIFSWTELEPEEGRYELDWLEEVINRLHENDISVFLATPTGARPAWMSRKYPEVLRVQADRTRNLHGLRHNHCFTSPVYREKTEAVNRKLAERFAAHQGVIGWHISNEYGGDCHCNYCQEAFRSFLKKKYGTLDALNHAWWTTFWSHTYTSWEEVESPAPHGESMVHGMNLDWKRFVTEQTRDFFRHEIQPIRKISPQAPVTTNFMGDYEGLNYWKFVDDVSIVSWDSYPLWHQRENDILTGSWTSMMHDLNRSLSRGPFLLMESTPSVTNWQPHSKLKEPGMHLLSSLQAVAHGSDSVQYFQWRKSRGSSEKLHGAVVGHDGTEHTRVFRDVQDTGEALKALSDIAGSGTKAPAAVIYDWENRWALKDAQGPRNESVFYEETVHDYYHAFWQAGIPVDVIDSVQPLQSYKIVAAPMLYMLRPGVKEALESFVAEGGTLLLTHWSGVVDENDLAFLGRPPLADLTGIVPEEIDGMYESQIRRAAGKGGIREFRYLTERSHVESAEVLSSFTDDFFRDHPAVTRNNFKNGTVYYTAGRVESAGVQDLIHQAAEESGVEIVPLPEGVTRQKRETDTGSYLFYMNFSGEEQVYSHPEKAELLFGSRCPLEKHGIHVWQVRKEEQK